MQTDLADTGMKGVCLEDKDGSFNSEILFSNALQKILSGLKELNTQLNAVRKERDALKEDRDRWENETIKYEKELAEIKGRVGSSAKEVFWKHVETQGGGTYNGEKNAKTNP
jgi:predicted nuclease with TOPRIM domain